MDLPHTMRVGAQLKAIPRDRLMTKIGRTLLGLFFLAGAVGMAGYLKSPWYTYLPVAVLGGWLISAELMQRGVGFVIALVKDLLTAVRGKNGTPPAGPIP